MNDFLNGLKKTTFNKMQVDLKIRKDGVRPGNNFIVPSDYTSGGKKESKTFHLAPVSDPE